MKQMAANGSINESDFDISAIEIGSIDGVRVLPSGDDEGGWIVESDTGLATDFGEVLRSSGDVFVAN